MAGSESNPVAVAEIFEQAVYQFASNCGAASLYDQIGAKCRSWRSVSVRGTQDGTLTELVHARFIQRVDGHQALLVIEYLTDSKVGGPPTVTLWTLDGTDIYMVSSQYLHGQQPAAEPHQASADACPPSYSS